MPATSQTTTPEISRKVAAAMRALSAPPGAVVKISDSRAAIELCQQEIFSSQLKYSDIADRASISHSTVSNIATGSTRFPRVETLVRILGVLGWEMWMVPKSMSPIMAAEFSRRH